MIALVAACMLSACARNVNSTKLDFSMGEKVPNGPLTYTVVESSWRTELGQGFKIRTPQNRFLMITLSATNGGGNDVTLPLFSMEDGNGKTYTEMENGEGVENWFGFLRSLAPAQTRQGRLVFDVPLASYRLKLPNGGEAGEEVYVTVQIPLRLDMDSVQAPLPGGFGK